MNVNRNKPTWMLVLEETISKHPFDLKLRLYYLKSKIKYYIFGKT